MQVLLSVEVGAGLLVERDGLSGSAYIVHTEDLCATLEGEGMEEGRTTEGFGRRAAEGTVDHALA